MRILLLSRPFVVLIIPLLIVMLLALTLALSLGSIDLVVEVLILIGSLDSLFKHCRRCVFGSIFLYVWIKSLEELSYLLLHRIYQLRCITTQPLEFGEILKHGHVALHKLLELGCLLSLDMCWYIFLPKLSLETNLSLIISHSPVFCLHCLPLDICQAGEHRSYNLYPLHSRTSEELKDIL